MMPSNGKIRFIEELWEITFRSHLLIPICGIYVCVEHTAFHLNLRANRPHGAIFLFNGPTSPLIAGIIIYYINIDVDDFSGLNSVHIWYTFYKYVDIVLFVEQDPTELEITSCWYQRI